MQRLHLDEVIDAVIPRHGSHQGLSIGQLILGWTTFILSQSVRLFLQQPGLLYLGDSKMSAKATRADIACHGDFYLLPLAAVGEIPQLLSACIESAGSGNQPATLIYAPCASPEGLGLVAAGYERTREQSGPLPTGKPFVWTERLLVIRSYSDVKKEVGAMHQRLQQAQQGLWALTPEPQRGRRPIRSESLLHQRAQTILEHVGVSG